MPRTLRTTWRHRHHEAYRRSEISREETARREREDLPDVETPAGRAKAIANLKSYSCEVLVTLIRRAHFRDPLERPVFNELTEKCYRCLLDPVYGNQDAVALDQKVRSIGLRLREASNEDDLSEFRQQFTLMLKQLIESADAGPDLERNILLAIQRPLLNLRRHFDDHANRRGFGGMIVNRDNEKTQREREEGRRGPIQWVADPPDLPAEAPEDDQPEDEAVLRAERVLAAAVEALPERVREALRLRREKGSTRAAAEALNLSHTAVNNWFRKVERDWDADPDIRAALAVCNFELDPGRRKRPRQRRTEDQ